MTSKVSSLAAIPECTFHGKKSKGRSATLQVTGVATDDSDAQVVLINKKIHEKGIS